MKKILKGIVLMVAVLGVYSLVKQAIHLPEHISNFLKSMFPKYYYTELTKKFRDEHHI